MKNNNIPAGYQVTITSWENDADHYQDHVFRGLSEEDVIFLTELCPLFESHSVDNKNFGGDWDRKGIRYEEMADAITDVIANNPDISVAMQDRWLINRNKDFWEDQYQESISELIGYPAEGYPDNYRRVFESLVVHYFPQEVEDVTSKFSVK